MGCVLEGRLYDEHDWQEIHLTVDLSMPPGQEPPRWGIGGTIECDVYNMRVRREVSIFAGNVAGFCEGLRELKRRRSGQVQLPDTEMLDILWVTTSAKRWPSYLVGAYWRDILDGSVELEPGEYHPILELPTPRLDSAFFALEGMVVHGAEIAKLVRYLRQLLRAPGLAIDAPY